MHERTQRWVCRLVFLLACVVPTVGTFFSIVYFHRPWLERDWERLLESSLHVRASIARVEVPRPGERNFYDVHLESLPTRTALVTINKLQIIQGKTWDAEQVKVSFEKISTLAGMVQTWLSSEDMPLAEIHAKNLLLTNNRATAWELADLQMAIGESDSQNCKVTILAEVQPESAKPAQVKLQITRSANDSWSMLLDSPGGNLPMSLIAEIVPGATRWKEARLTGSLQINYVDQALSGAMTGHIVPIDLQTWIGQDSPHKLRAEGRLQFESLRWQDQRLTEAKGAIESEPGQISRSLVTALEKLLFCVPANQQHDASDGEIISFDKLAGNFTMNSAGLTVTGNCRTTSSGSSGCLLSVDGGPFLLQPAYSSIPLQYFVQVFCPLEKYWLPEIQKAAELAERLPQPAQEIPRK